MIADITTKQCSKCDAIKPASAFYKDRRRQDGLRSECKMCTEAAQKEYNNTHSEEIAAQHKKYRLAHREKIVAYYKRWLQGHRAEKMSSDKEYQKAHPEKCATRDKRRRARKLLATVESFDMQDVWKRNGEFCAYCGATENLEVDHIVALSQGGVHSLDNLTVACRSCNASKDAKDLKEWQLWKTQR